jgi:hypothetical protein
MTVCRCASVDGQPERALALARRGEALRGDPSLLLLLLVWAAEPRTAATVG